MATERSEVVPIPCGGCGATENIKRCINCMHDFGTPDSAWVRNYASASRAVLVPEDPAGEVDA